MKHLPLNTSDQLRNHDYTIVRSSGLEMMKHLKWKVVAMQSDAHSKTDNKCEQIKTGYIRKLMQIYGNQKLITIWKSL